MKIPLHLLAALSLAGCGSLDLPDLAATGRDARTYNPQTGRYEWPDNEPARQPAKPRVKARDDAPADAAKPSDGRDFNPQTGRFESPRE